MQLKSCTLPRGQEGWGIDAPAAIGSCWRATSGHYLPGISSVPCAWSKFTPVVREAPAGRVTGVCSKKPQAGGQGQCGLQMLSLVSVSCRALCTHKGWF